MKFSIFTALYFGACVCSRNVEAQWILRYVLVNVNKLRNKETYIYLLSYRSKSSKLLL